ncbi:hypothetical protein [Arthrobacter sp. IK3]|uniref:hypothetical protein n=1 Tax=Arthrobacter sp. IK3 TaxID=3448169 RepID=UPI003EE0A637
MTATAVRRCTSSPEWSLFMDWCTAADVSPLPAAAETVAEFFRDVPAASSTRRRRLQAIRRVHAEAGAALALPVYEPDKPWRLGPGWLDLSETLRRAPLAGWPGGLAARRDMFLAVLIGECGFSREQAREVPASSVRQDLDGTWLIGRHRVACTPEPGPCPSCAVARWMEVLRIWDDRGKHSVRSRIAGYRPTGEHECREPAGPVGDGVHTLLPGIDRHGWLSDWEPLSARSISAVLAYRQDESRWPAEQTSSPAREERPDFQRSSMQDLTEILDELDDKVARALKESEAIMARAMAAAGG